MYALILAAAKVDIDVINATAMTVLTSTIMQQILRDMWQSGDMLPTVAAMAEHYQVGRGTNNRALRPLADDGLLVIRERWGRSALSHADPAPPVPPARLSEPPCRLAAFQPGLYRPPVR